MRLVLVKLQLDAIADACREHQVLRMHLFGSAVRDDFDPSRSDLDLLVEFQMIDPGALVAAFFGLEHQLTESMGHAIPFVRADIDASKQLIYGVAE